ncbi:T9SS sorting signal type C domain-containing protein [Flavobacterium subsaxonicum]|uniref:PKD domain-containing protein n=1 Tax=Flavobacterium subsaxonicum WB 4.1-42 = DSM 21790 TaxID=1121898 RepID=A0A0A2MJ64_9FLAO|nr:T9SS sorting signal type C domain-containing protein [Flavobacterium subsaxonicum]KGO91616.1 hypothetical protein Q766_17285 [Flavobacterium subsaxonicum WB 4.1-42 = DSM 21790]
MKAKQLFRAIFTIAFFCYCGFGAFAQTQYANSVSSQAYVASPTLAHDQNLATAARITTTNVAVTLEGHIELQFSSVVPANTPAYVKINMQETDQLKALLGGALGDLLDDVLGIVLGDQYLQVIVSNNGATPAVLTSTSFTSNTMRIVQDGTGDYYIRIVPTGNYNRIRINNKLGGIIASRWLDVYEAFYTTGANSCGIGNYTSYEGVGVVSLLGANVTNANRAIDANTTNYSTINLGTLAVGVGLQQSIYFAGTAATTDSYNIKFQMANTLVDLGVLGSVHIIGYDGSGTIVYNKALNDAAFVSLGIATGLANGQPVSINIQPGVAIQRLALRYTSIAGVGLTAQELHLYGITRGSFGVSLAGAGSYQTGATIPLVATVTGCTGPYTYSWTGTGATSSTTNTASPVLTTPGTYNYTVTVTDKFGIQQTATASVVIEQPPVGGTVAGTQTVCSGLLASDLTLSGYTGNIIKWQRATNAAFTDATDIANTTATLTGAELGPLDTTTYVRAVVGRFTYANVNSTNYATLTVKGTTWNGTAWSNGAPDLSTTAFFTGAYNVDADLNACRIIVSNNAVVNIPSENLVTVQHNINVQTGSITFQNNAHLIQQTGEANIGNVTVKKKASELYRLDYTLWSSPVNGQKLGQFSPFTSTGRFYEYGYFNGSNIYMEKYNPVADLTAPFTVGKGYLIRMPNSITGGPTGPYYAGTQTYVFEGKFTGVPNNGTITYPLSINGERYTATGNPYASPINVQAFFDANEDVMAEESAIYFWRKKNDHNATTYTTLTRDAYVYNNASGGVAGDDIYGGKIWDDFFNNDVDPADWVINVGQGFIIQAAQIANPVVTFTNSMRRGAIYNNQFFKGNMAGQTQETRSRFWINIAGSANNSFSQAALVYSSNATLGLDKGRDGKMFSNESPLAFYSIQDANNLTIQARPQFTDSDVVAMGYRADVAGQYSISISRKDGVFADQAVYIKDNQLGITKNISTEAYTFTTEAGTINNRFEIVYKQQGALSTNNPELLNNSVVVYQQNNVINITAANTQITDVTVYDMRGRRLYGKTGINATQTTIDNLNVQKEVIIVEVNTVNGKVTKKIIF